VWESPHGILEGPAGIEPGDYLAWSWVGFGRAAQSYEAFRGLVTAGSVAEARAALAGLGTLALNFVLADRAGEVGYQFAGAIPERRPGWSGLYPVAGWERENDWRGMVDQARLPAAYPADLPNGVYATANDRPDRDGGPPLSTLPQPPYRRDRILELLGGERKLTLADLEHAQYDLTSLQARRLLPLFLPYLPEGEIKHALERWDLRYDAAAREPTLFENLYAEVLQTVFCQGAWGPWLTRVFADTPLLTLLFGRCDDVIAAADSPWLPAGERDELLRRACTRGAARSAEPWGARHTLTLRHLLLGGKLGRRLGLDRGPVPWWGGRATVAQASLFRQGGRVISFAACYHFVTGLADARSWTNTPAGPSEHPLARGYASDHVRWMRGEYRELSPTLATEVECVLVP
jgi:penicillin amidase